MCKLFFLILLMVPTGANSYAVADLGAFATYQGVVESVFLQNGWEEYQTDMKPVVVGVRAVSVEIAGAVANFNCEIVVGYLPLDFGEGVFVKGDSYAEIEFRGQFFYPKEVENFVASDGCYFIPP